MDWIKFRDMVRRFWKKYCVVVLAVAAGLLLLVSTVCFLKGMS